MRSKRALTAVIALAVMLVAVSFTGCLEEEPDQGGEDQNEAPSSQSPQVYRVTVDYNGTWRGLIAQFDDSQSNLTSTTRTIEGTGEAEYLFRQPDQFDAWVLAVTVMKTDGSDSTMIVRLLDENDQVLEESTTDMPFGIAYVTSTAP